MIFHEAAKLLILALVFGERKGGPSVPAAPFPATKPEDLPAWPNGWCPDLPPAPEVATRAWELLPTLWGKGEGTRTVEMTGGRWITYVASTVDGQKSVAAYRTVDCEPAAPSVVVPPAGPVPSAPADDSPALVTAAIGMNEALRLRGYKQVDMIHYQDFQRAAGLAVDGYPGTNTMAKLELVLSRQGIALAPVKIYPWKATGAYDGINAPTAAEWAGSQVPASSPIAPPPAPPASPRAVPASYTPPAPPPSVAPVSPSPLNATWAVKTDTDAQHALNALGYTDSQGRPLVEDGKVGANTMFATLQFQKEHPPLAQDTIPGPLTKAALTAALQRGEHRSAPAAAPSVFQPPVFVPAGYVPPSAAAVIAPPGPVVASNTDVQHALNVLGYKGKDGKPLVEDGAIGPNSKYAVGAFQKEHPPLAVDQNPGPLTKAALSSALGQIARAA